MKVYASISGGKDSLAALITHMERGGQCDGAIYCRIMFDDETSAEVPEHEEWLHSKCFPLLEREYGIKTQIVQGKYTYTENNFQRITASRETLAAFLGTIPAIETPWDDAFHRLYCSSCSAADCDDCRRPERDSPLWWLGLPAAEAEK